MKRIIYLLFLLFILFMFPVFSIAQERKIISKGNLNFEEKVIFLEEDFQYLDSEIQRLKKE